MFSVRTARCKCENFARAIKRQDLRKASRSTHTHTHTYTYIKLAKFIHEPAAKPLTYQIGLGQLKLIYGPGMGSYAGRRIFAVIVAGNNFVSGPIGKRLFSSLLRFRFFFSRRGKIAGIDERR